MSVFVTGEDYLLKHSVILDSRATLHIFNDIRRFASYKEAPLGDVIWAGDTKVQVQGYGKIALVLSHNNKKHQLALDGVAHCPTLHTSVVSFRKLRSTGFYWDTFSRPTLLKTLDHKAICALQEQGGQYVLDYQTPDQGGFFGITRRTWVDRPPSLATAMLWHQRFGHPGPEPLKRLISLVQGVRMKGITTIECEACAVGKAKALVSRRPRTTAKEVGERIAIDLHDYGNQPNGYGGYRAQLLATDRWSDLMWDYYLPDHKNTSLLAALEDLFAHLQHQYNLVVKVVECDNEITSREEVVAKFKGISFEPSAPDTQAQNGGAERSGGVVKERARTLRCAANFPEFLWPEITKAAVYLLNRTPTQKGAWRTPYERFLTRVAERAGNPTENNKPTGTHLKAYGCKAYALTTDAKKKRNRLKRLDPHAWIGYLIGYQSTNIYRVWVPQLNRVISSRDVTFDEGVIFDGHIDTLKDQAKAVDGDDLIQLINQAEVPEPETSTTVDQSHYTTLDEPLVELPGVKEDDAESVAESEIVVASQPVHQEESGVPISRAPDPLVELPPIRPYRTPPLSPPRAFLAHTYTKADSNQKVGYGGESITLHAAMAAGRLAAPVAWSEKGQLLDKAAVIRSHRKGDSRATNPQQPLQPWKPLHKRIQQGQKVHRRELPTVPRSHSDLHNHPMEQLFLAAEEDHLQGHQSMKTWTNIPRGEVGRGQQILDCMWVYTYKCDSHGNFTKCKARLVVRGDQQKGVSREETYAATLAGRSFRTLIATAARFNLELKQYDAINAFVNARLPQPVYMRQPPGQRTPGEVLQLHRALYGLRISPLLWQQELTTTLVLLGFETVPHEPCCMIKNGIILFFYVDDIVLVYNKRNHQAAMALMELVKQKYALTGGGELQWFLGMSLHRDRKKRLIWLSQAAYFDKISKLATTLGPDKTPMGPEELLPYQELATAWEIQTYQKKVGSLGYAATQTRPDIAFAVSRLSRFLINPGPKHHQAADRVLRYLKRTQYHSLRLGGDDGLMVASDASFGDNRVDRKSSQGYAMKLFGGLVAWKANKQSTVTTSTTEAELLSLSEAAKESIFLSRLIKELSVRLDQHHITIQCDNTQTIRLVTQDTVLLQTRLRHIDIHQHWLRQEVQRGRIKVVHVQSDDMIADGLTKALPTGKWNQFLAQMGVEARDEVLLAIKQSQLQLGP